MRTKAKKKRQKVTGKRQRTKRTTKHRTRRAKIAKPITSKFAQTKLRLIYSAPEKYDARKPTLVPVLNHNDFYRTLGKLLQVLRKQHNVSQEEVAKVLDLHQAAICRIERGMQMPSTLQLYTLARMFNENVDTLLAVASGMASAIPDLDVAA